jgi:hypothetical protein
MEEIEGEDRLSKEEALPIYAISAFTLNLECDRTPPQTRLFS